jgi:hypothetical protein
MPELIGMWQELAFVGAEFLRLLNGKCQLFRVKKK